MIFLDTEVLGLEGVTAEVVEVTPEMAREWLKNDDIKNRRLRPQTIKEYQRAIRENRWALNGEPFIFSEDGKLYDGYHRANAIANEGISIRSVIVKGVPKTALPTINIGLRRTFADHLEMTGENNSPQVASVTNLLDKWGPNGRSSRTWLNGWRSSNPRLGLVLEQNRKNILDAVEWSKTKGKNIEGLTVALRAFVYVALGQVSTAKRDEFMNALATGVTPREDDPIHVLRHCLLKNAGKKRNKAQTAELLVWVFKTWNARQRNQTIARLFWTDAEEFVVPIS